MAVLPIADPPTTTPMTIATGSPAFVWDRFFRALQLFANRLMVILFSGTAGQVLTSNGPGVDPSFQTLAAGMVNLFPTANVVVPAGYSLVCATTFHLASGITLSIGAEGAVAII